MNKEDIREFVAEMVKKSVGKEYMVLYKHYSILKKRGVVLDAEWSVRNRKIIFVPTMWIDVAGDTRVKERPLEEITLDQCVEMLYDRKADLVRGYNLPQTSQDVI